MPHQSSARRPPTLFATVLEAIDKKETGDHVHITKTQHSSKCFPTGFETVMSNGFKVRVTIRKRERDKVGRVTCKGSEKIVQHAGPYLEKICKNLTVPRTMYPRHWGSIQLVSFGARFLD